MTDDRKKMSPRFAKRAARMNALCEKLGLKPLAENRVQEIFEAHKAKRGDAFLTTRALYADCRSVTNAARMLGMRRSALFAWLEDGGWLHRVEGGGWRATREAVDAEWAVQRGPVESSWPQITLAGVQEISRRFNLDDPDT